MRSTRREFMKFLDDYVTDFRANVQQLPLADLIAKIKAAYDVRIGGNPQTAFQAFVNFYNSLGDAQTKAQYAISSNLARNLPGALMQDWLVHLALQLVVTRPELFIFTEVRVLFGTYPVWEAGNVSLKMPSEKSDLAIGYIRDEKGSIEKNASPWPPPVVTTMRAKCSVVPLVTMNSKIRVSQSEFFDWQGREQLMTKGNPHCLSIQVALRKEMDYSIVEAAQASEKFFLLGSGSETNVVPDQSELDRLIHVVGEHMARRMNG
jgi:hypothetical protein